MKTVKKVLYFEGAGWSGADISKATVGNGRIRTAFHLDDATPVYLEIIACEVTRNSPAAWQRMTHAGFVDDFHIIGDDGEARYTSRQFSPFEYSYSGILALVNSLGCSFDGIEVLHDLSGYRVHSGNGGYNFADEFTPDHDLIVARQQVDAWIRKKEIARGEKSICYSLWVDSSESALLHYKNLRSGETFDIFPGIPADASRLPVLHKSNAIPGCYYSFGSDGWQQLHRVYRISEEYAEENGLLCLDRCETSVADFALPGGDIHRAQD